MNNNWKPQTLAFDEDIHQAMQQQQHAAQLIAMVGHQLIPQKADDSNTNMQFLSAENVLLGNPLPNGFKLSLGLTDLKLSILDKENNAVKQISLEGKNKQEAFNELKQCLSDLGVDVMDFKNKLHYEIPPHPLDRKRAFSITNEEDFIENAKYRHNAKIVLNEVAALFKQKEPIRIWPHHFDTGAFYVIKKDEEGEAIQTIGIGMAVPDAMVDEPYYYLSYWSKDSDEVEESLSALVAGHWMMPDWKGAVLRFSEIAEQKTAEEQYTMVKSFYKQGIEIIQNHFKNF